MFFRSVFPFHIVFLGGLLWKYFHLQPRPKIQTQETLIIFFVGLTICVLLHWIFQSRWPSWLGYTFLCEVFLVITIKDHLK